MPSDQEAVSEAVKWEHERQRINEERLIMYEKHKKLKEMEADWYKRYSTPGIFAHFPPFTKEKPMSDGITELYQTVNEQDRLTAALGGCASDKATQTQIGGDHYVKLGAYQPWEVLKRWLTPEEYRGYLKGTAIAYLARERDKGGMQDIKKAEHTLQAMIEAGL